MLLWVNLTCYCKKITLLLHKPFYQVLYITILFFSENGKKINTKKEKSKIVILLQQSFRNIKSIWQRIVILKNQRSREEKKCLIHTTVYVFTKQKIQKGYKGSGKKKVISFQLILQNKPFESLHQQSADQETLDGNLFASALKLSGYQSELHQHHPHYYALISIHYVKNNENKDQMFTTELLMNVFSNL